MVIEVGIPFPLNERWLVSVIFRDCPVGTVIRTGDHPPDAATVERVLAVARGDALATDVGAGRRVCRTNGRLRIEIGR